MGEWYQRYLKLLPSPEARHAFVRVLRPMAQIKDADVSDDSDIHGVPKVPGQSSEDLAKQAFLQVIGIMKNVRQKKIPKGSRERAMELWCTGKCVLPS